MTIPSGGPTWHSDPSWSPTSPARSKTTPAKVAARRSGLHGEAARARHLSAKSQCGGPPTASIPKTHDQPVQEANSKRPRPSGNNTSTGKSPVPPIRQTTRGSTKDRQHTPHLVAGTTRASAPTKHPVNVRTGQPHPAANPRRRAAAKGCDSPDTVMARSHRSRLPNRALSGSEGPAFGWPGCACPLHACGAVPASLPPSGVLSGRERDSGHPSVRLARNRLLVEAAQSPPRRQRQTSRGDPQIELGRHGQ
jgi:hypothetical protein